MTKFINIRTREVVDMSWLSLYQWLDEKYEIRRAARQGRILNYLLVVIVVTAWVAIGLLILNCVGE
jgi:hypothetical protein